MVNAALKRYGKIDFIDLSSSVEHLGKVAFLDGLREAGITGLELTKETFSPQSYSRVDFGRAESGQLATGLEKLRLAEAGRVYNDLKEKAGISNIALSEFIISLDRENVAPHLQQKSFRSFRATSEPSLLKPI